MSRVVASVWTVGVLLLVVSGCSGSATESTAPRGTASRPPAGSVSSRDASAGPVRDERGTGLVHLSIADNGESVLVDGGQRLELTIASDVPWVAPYVEGPRGQTGQDRVVYLQEATGFPGPAPAFARLLAANPGDVVIASQAAACASACDASMTFRVRIYVGTVPSSS